MVTPTARRGLSLVEVVVAFAVLTIGVLGAAAIALRASERLREAEAVEAALLAGTAVLDSLLQRKEIGPGIRRTGRFVVRWTVDRQGGASTVEVDVSYHDGTRARRLSLSARHSPPPPRLGGGR